MFRRIKDFDKVPPMQQIKKIYEELEEFEKEVVNGNEEGQMMEGADLIQSVLTFFNNKGYTKNDYERMFRDLYIKESKRGRTVVCLDGETHQDILVAELLDVIAEKEKEIRDLKSCFKLIKNIEEVAPDQE